MCSACKRCPMCAKGAGNAGHACHMMVRSGAAHVVGAQHAVRVLRLHTSHVFRHQHRHRRQAVVRVQRQRTGRSTYQQFQKTEKLGHSTCRQFGIRFAQY